MNAEELLQDLRDVMSKAAREGAGHVSGSNPLPLDEVAGTLAARDVLSDADAKLIIAFLDHFDPDDGYSLVDAVPDSLSIDITRIIEQLRAPQETSDSV